MKNNTQITHTKFQKYKTSPTGVLAKRKKKTAKSFFWASQHFSFFFIVYHRVPETQANKN
jgi:hypothetical protein